MNKENVSRCLHTKGQASRSASSPADPKKILLLPLVEKAVDLLKLCSLTEAVGVIHGPNGTGKTEILRILERDYAACGLPGTVVRLRCCQQAGASRGIKDMLAEMGPGGVFVAVGQAASVALLCKAAVRAFEKRDVRALLLDEADLWDAGLPQRQGTPGGGGPCWCS